MIIQTNQFVGVSPETLYHAYLNATEHGKMTTSGVEATSYYRPGTGNVEVGEAGDELRAWSFKDENGTIRHNLRATILSLVPGKLIVQRWKNIPWTLATNPGLVTDLESTLVLTFKKTAFGAEIQMVHVNVPDYEVYIKETGEIAPLYTIVGTHWGLQYWEPMKKYFGCNK
ncbi:MAG: SRPBCC domain-containing protein [Bacteroidota bacterium]|nr:SRPBCC domain-containing protein [Bacteroidota bacterium]